ncbi:hypothetical protein [Vibrio aerogenes]|uniref:hypothetical protein n=1 Tax=Vibrio aerogenes TaxID=92172 RepID=UPI0039EF2F0B
MNSPAVTEKKQTLIINKDATHYDRKYYDVELLTGEETSFCLDIGQMVTEGEIIVLSPNKEKKSGSKIHRFKNAGELFASEMKQVKALIVAGVGSSLLGTAALARSVANVYDIDVAGIVSGHGTKDLTDEALEGWFFNRTWDVSQQYLRLMNDNMNTLSKFTPFPWYFNPLEVPLEWLEAATKDVRSTIEVLENPASEVELILGHSKGSLVIDRALEFIAQKYESHALFEKLNVVSIATVLNFPLKFKNIFQFLGEFDALGEKNSRHLVEFEMVTGAEHSLRSGSALSLDRLLPGHAQLKNIFSTPKTPIAKKTQPEKSAPAAKAEQPAKPSPAAKKAEQPIKADAETKSTQPVKSSPAAKKAPAKRRPAAKKTQPPKSTPATKGTKS